MPKSGRGCPNDSISNRPSPYGYSHPQNRFSGSLKAAQK
nr:MAG TPA: hypothetical protein [Caudoviricetes sp.]